MVFKLEYAIPSDFARSTLVSLKTLDFAKIYRFSVVQKSFLLEFLLLTGSHSEIANNPEESQDLSLRIQES